MNSKRLLLVLGMSIPLCGCTARTQLRPEAKYQQKYEVMPDSGEDLGSDLDWLVGRWKCIVRYYVNETVRLTESNAEDQLDTLVVYFPYADDNVSVNLTDNVSDHPIAAEFLNCELLSNEFTKKDGEATKYRYEMLPMMPLGQVYISKSRIYIGDEPGGFGFRYRVMKQRKSLWLILDSGNMHLELLKTSSTPGDIKTSTVKAPIRNYTPEHIQKIIQRYEELRRTAQSNGDH